MTKKCSVTVSITDREILLSRSPYKVIQDWQELQDSGNRVLAVLDKKLEEAKQELYRLVSKRRYELNRCTRKCRKICWCRRPHMPMYLDVRPECYRSVAHPGGR